MSFVTQAGQAGFLPLIVSCAVAVCVTEWRHSPLSVICVCVGLCILYSNDFFQVSDGTDLHIMFDILQSRSVFLFLFYYILCIIAAYELSRTFKSWWKICFVISSVFVNGSLAVLEHSWGSMLMNMNWLGSRFTYLIPKGFQQNGDC